MLNIATPVGDVWGVHAAYLLLVSKLLRVHSLKKYELQQIEKKRTEPIVFLTRPGRESSVRNPGSLWHLGES